MGAPTLNTNRLHELRKRRGLTAKELGQLADISARHVWRLERGSRGAGSETLARLALALGTTMEYLMGITDDDRDIHTLTGEDQGQ